MKLGDLETASPLQFRNTLLRMMPSALSGMPEARLVAALFQHAWEDATNYTDARRFFNERSGAFNTLCSCCGLDGSQVRQMYLRRNRIALEQASKGVKA